MMLKLFFIIVPLLLPKASLDDETTYHKSYYKTGETKSEGWLDNEGSKTGYWKFYHPNGNCSEKGYYQNNKKEKYWYFYSKNKVRIQEGHYRNGEKTNWWLFYDPQGRIKHKCQLDKGRKNGYCLKYEDERLTSAEKYQNGKKIKEWFDFSSFRRENNLTDLK